MIDKIDEFSAELKNPATGEQERRLALQFLLHFVGDVHQPLHAADDHDQGGNRKIVSAPGIASNNLAPRLGYGIRRALGGKLRPRSRSGCSPHITDSQRARWSAGTPGGLGHGVLLRGKVARLRLVAGAEPAESLRASAEYVSDATAVTAEQLSKAGVRLAFMLNQALQ